MTNAYFKYLDERNVFGIMRNVNVGNRELDQITEGADVRCMDMLRERMRVELNMDFRRKII